MNKHAKFLVQAVATVAIFVCASTVLAERSFAQGAAGDVVVRIDDTSGSHCIDADTEKLTIFVRRVFVEKQKGWFTEDKRAGVLVRSSLSGVKTNGTDDATPAEVKVPAVDLVSVKDDPKGRVSLALEYPVASGLLLKQNDVVTKTIDIYMNLAKTKGKTTFGTVLDIAGQALNQLPIPPNPYSQSASKYLKFANDAIDKSIAADNDDQIAHIGMQFNEGTEGNLDVCKAHGNERTGAIAVLRSVGTGGDLVPTTNTDEQYCFRYSSNSTFELLAARRLAGGLCPPPTAFSGVNNDYVMLLVSAQLAPSKSKGLAMSDAVKKAIDESRKRCDDAKLPHKACGVS